jgi:hypothetical protein
MSLATAGFDPRPFSPGWSHEPGLKSANEPGLKGLGPAAEKRRGAHGISPGLFFSYKLLLLFAKRTCHIEWTISIHAKINQVLEAQTKQESLSSLPQ